MAAPITHIVLAEKIFEKYFADKDKLKFILGTVFPDIRRLGKISRNSTHLGDVSFGEVLAEDSFIAGLKFHQYVDLALNKFSANLDYYSLFPVSERVNEGGKVFMDKVLYEKVTDWKEIKKYFDIVCDEELQFGISKEVVVEWHRKISGYISQKPVSVDDIDHMITDPIEVSIEIARVANGVLDVEKATRIVEDFYDNFEEVIKKAGY